MYVTMYNQFTSGVLVLTNRSSKRRCGDNIKTAGDYQKIVALSLIAQASDLVSGNNAKQC